MQLADQFVVGRQRPDDRYGHAEDRDRIDVFFRAELVFCQAISRDTAHEHAEHRRNERIPYAVEYQIEKRGVFQIEHFKRLEVVGKFPVFRKRERIAAGIFQRSLQGIEKQPDERIDQGNRVQQKDHEHDGKDDLFDAGTASDNDADFFFFL